MTPSDAAKRKAEDLLLSMKSALTNKFTREEAFFIRDQIAAALHIEPGFIRDSEGVEHKGKWDHVDISVYKTVLAFIPDDQQAAQQSASERGGGGC